uniref:Uncharacterized protein n=1 Tax=Chloropicon laureae TaxID=464258 RepID=A0A7S3DZB8_9CHLO|mmetsp:Transcript_10788/g.27701  ORF Transcript_10788/g.27701 Transcript_10788/m.27701 type:complete len:218 (+) Transcript_10788:110-763(+)
MHFLEVCENCPHMMGRALPAFTSTAGSADPMTTLLRSSEIKVLLWFSPAQQYACDLVRSSRPAHSGKSGDLLRFESPGNGQVEWVVEAAQLDAWRRTEEWGAMDKGICLAIFTSERRLVVGRTHCEVVNYVESEDYDLGGEAGLICERKWMFWVPGEGGEPTGAAALSTFPDVLRSYVCFLVSESYHITELHPGAGHFRVSHQMTIDDWTDYVLYNM